MAAERILVVDADSETASTIARTLEHHGLAVQTVPDCTGAVRAVLEFRPRLVISNATSCGADAIDLGRALETYPAPILQLTMRDVLYNRDAMLTRVRRLLRASGRHSGVERLEAPAMPVDAPPHPATLALRLMPASAIAMSGSTAHPALVLDTALSDIFVNGHAAHLTATEFNIMSQLVAGGGAIVAYNSLLEHIWGAAYRGDHHLLQVHIQRLRLKLEQAGAPRDMVRNRRALGYIVDSRAPDGVAVRSAPLPHQLAG